MDKPTTAAGYQGAQTQLVRATCLYVATKLGDYAKDLVLVGGLVPSLLIDQQNLPPGADAHVGTVDLDVVLSVVLLHEEKYKAVGKQLRRAGFKPDINAKGNPSRQRWMIQVGQAKVTMDFLIPPTLEDDKGGRIRDLEEDFAAFIMPGTQLAFEDRVEVELEGTTIFGERAKRTIQVCGPGAFVVLKALALRNRGENKDAYDLVYVLRNYSAGTSGVALRLAPLMTDADSQRALSFLEEDFATFDSVGPMRAARFLTEPPDENVQAEAVAFVGELIRLVRGTSVENK